MGRRRTQDGPLGRRRPAQGAHHRALRLGRAGRRRRPDPSLRRRAVLPLRSLPSRDRPPRHRTLTGPPLRARDQRLRREVHPDPQGTGPVDRALRHARAAARPRALCRRPQRAPAARTPRQPHPTPSTQHAPSRRHRMITAFTNQRPVNPVRRSSNGVPAANASSLSEPRGSSTRAVALRVSMARRDSERAPG